MTLAQESSDAALTGRLPTSATSRRATGFEHKPVEFWPTSAIRAAVETGDITVWQHIVAALKRDPFGRTARQVEEVLDTMGAGGITRALAEVLTRSRAALDAEERAEVAREVRGLVHRSGLNAREFASRVGVTADQLTAYQSGDVSPPASLMVRMHRLSNRFAKIKAQRDPAAGR